MSETQPSADSSAEQSNAMDKAEIKRRRVAQELLDTEITYVKHLNTVLRVFYEPLLKNAQTSPEPVISTDDIRNIFSSLKMIKPINEMLLNQLKTKISVPDTDPILIGETFLNMTQCFKSYSVYCHDYEKAVKLIARLKKSNPAFEGFLASINDPSQTENKSLGDYLIMPVQRVPRYRLLLTELLKYTKPQHPDYENLVEVVDAITVIADLVERAQDKYANIDKIVEISERIRGRKASMPSLLQAHRLLLLEISTDIKIIEEVEPQREFPIKSRKVFLFNDILLLVKPSVDRRTKQEIYKNHQIFTITDVKDVLRSVSQDPTQASISLIFEASTLCLFINNAKDRDNWFKALNDCRNNLSANNIKQHLVDDKNAKTRPRRSKTLKKRADSPLPPKTDTSLRVTINPLIGMNNAHQIASMRGSRPRFSTVQSNLNLSSLVNPTDDLKKSTSMNAIVDVNVVTPTTPSGFPAPSLVTLEKRRQFARSTSACLGKSCPTGDV